MATMEQSIPATPDDRLTHLRLKIKAWEREFTKSHGGTPPSKSDMDKNPKIAARYKEYHKLSKDAKSRSKVESISSGNFRKQDEVVHETQKTVPEIPKSEKKTLIRQESTTILHTTPQKSAEDREAAVLRFSNKEFINPTPQRNGKVLGLFESFMSPSSRSQLSDSPMKKRQQASDKAYIDALTGSGVTNSPSQSVKRKGDRIDELRTPSKKRNQDHQDVDWSTPQSFRNPPKDAPTEMFESPAFFKNRRRSPSNPDESPQKILPRKPPVRGFSTMLAELRQAEKEAVDADAEEAMRQMDNEEEAMLASILGPGNGTKQDGSSASIVPSDFLSLTTSTRETTMGPLQADPVTKVWKKKGLKRQTKRVKIRPVKPAALNNRTAIIQSDDDEDSKGEEDDNPESKEDKTTPEENDSSGYDTTDSLSDLDEILRVGGGANKKPTVEQEQDSGNTGHKVKATANQNYRRLKIRGKATKTNSRSRFSRKKR